MGLFATIHSSHGKSTAKASPSPNPLPNGSLWKTSSRRSTATTGYSSFSKLLGSSTNGPSSIFTYTSLYNTTMNLPPPTHRQIVCCPNAMASSAFFPKPPSYFLLLALLIATSTAGNFYQDVDITWGDGRAKILDNGHLLTLSLDKYSGSGFQSKT